LGKAAAPSGTAFYGRGERVEKTVEQDLDASPADPILGLLAGLRYAAVGPVEGERANEGH